MARRKLRKPPSEQLVTNKIIPKVTCKLCGQQMLRLTQTHLTAKHDGLLIDDYTKQFGQLSTRPAVDGKPVLYLTGGPRNTGLTEQSSREICDLAAKGYPKTTIASYVGISPPTLDTWLKKGAPDNVDKNGNRLAAEMYYKFAQEYRQAEAIAEIQAIDYLIDAGRGDWRAAIEFLARRFPENWRPESRKIIDVEGTVEHQVKDLRVDKLLENPETAAMACELLERISQGDREVDIIEGEVVEGDEEEVG